MKRIIEVYRLNELEPGPKERAMQRMREWDSDDPFISEVISEDMEYIAGKAGYEDVKPEWSLGYSQGDGACFTGMATLELLMRVASQTLTDVEMHIIHKLQYWGFCEWTCSIRKTGSSFSHRYSHSNTIASHVEYNADYHIDRRGLGKMIDRVQAKLELSMTEHAREVCGEMERAGYAEIEYRSSEEFLAEEAKANDIWFDTSGRVATHGEDVEWELP